MQRETNNSVDGFDVIVINTPVPERGCLILDMYPYSILSCLFLSLSFIVTQTNIRIHEYSLLIQSTWCLLDCFLFIFGLFFAFYTIFFSHSSKTYQNSHVLTPETISSRVQPNTICLRDTWGKNEIVIKYVNNEHIRFTLKKSMWIHSRLRKTDKRKRWKEQIKVEIEQQSNERMT